LCWLHSVGQNHFCVILLLYPESTLQLCSSRRFFEVFKDLFRFPVSRQDDVVFRPDAHQSATSVRTTRYFRSNAHQCLEASNSSRLHPSGRNGKSFGCSSRRSQCFSASVRTTWLYCPDAIQCLTSIRISASRHSYGKTAATVWAMFSIRQERAYQVQPSGRQPSRSGRSKPYYGIYVQPKCNCPDARATPSGRGLVWKLLVLLWKGGYS